MQKIIGIIVRANNEDKALKKGKNVLEKIKCKKKLITNYRTFDQEDDLNNWKGKWAYLSPAIFIHSQAGKAFVEDRLQMGKEAYISTIDKFRTGTANFSEKDWDDFIYQKVPQMLKQKENRNFELLRHFAYSKGDKDGYFPHFLYFEDEPIFFKKSLTRKLKSGGSTFVVPAEVQY